MLLVALLQEQHTALQSECSEPVALLEDQAPHLPTVFSDLSEVSLKAHGTYTRNEIAQALGLKGRG